MPGKPRLGRHESRANSGSELHGSGFGIFVLWERKKKVQIQSKLSDNKDEPHFRKSHRL